MDARQRLVIRDAESWTDAWNQIVSLSQPPPAVPAVDFGNEVVIVAAMGTKPTGGYSIAVDEVRTLGDGVLISVVERSPGSGCVVGDVVTAPVIAVAVPRFTGQATFDDHPQLVSCR